MPLVLWVSAEKLVAPTRKHTPKKKCVEIHNLKRADLFMCENRSGAEMCAALRLVIIAAARETTSSKTASEHSIIKIYVLWSQADIKVREHPRLPPKWREKNVKRRERLVMPLSTENTPEEINIKIYDGKTIKTDNLWKWNFHSQVFLSLPHSRRASICSDDGIFLFPDLPFSTSRERNYLWKVGLCCRGGGKWKKTSRKAVEPVNGCLCAGIFDGLASGMGMRSDASTLDINYRFRQI